MRYCHGAAEGQVDVWEVLDGGVGVDEERDHVIAVVEG